MNQFIISDILFWLLVALLVLNIFQRRHKEKAEKKRRATLYLAMELLAIYAISVTLERFNLNRLLIVPILAIGAIIVWILRDKMFPFRLSCIKTGEKLPIASILFDDSNTLPEEK